MSELEKNLRALAHAPGHAADICNQAAERIAELEAALRIARNYVDADHDIEMIHKVLD